MGDLTDVQGEIALLLRQAQGVIAVRDHPRLARSVGRLAARGALVRLLPGVYVAAGLEQDVLTRIRAAARWDPDMVLFGAAAAWVSFWPTVPVAVVELVTRQRRIQPTGFHLSRRLIPAELVVERRGLRFTSPALTALDLCCTPLGGNGIDVALRSRATTLAAMRGALELTRNRRGNGDRRELLLDSRDAPWSEAERLAHRLLRAAGITGWRSNQPIRTADRTYWGDIVFERERLVLEIDGRAFHDGDHPAARETFENDRWRQNRLVLAGWRVIRITWSMLNQHPDQVVALVRQALEHSV
ncbi:hypothetical protein GCM10009841_09510 [Microlunatus panaciterrae]|uniref:Very-short-patch-repair endonuclease n=1 Tax=Microlunatus panaciterrae TaxID=400768 RepID=A0ABS2RLN8_9ACTN|nr:DUF559 domain-containing protein [Microlunatus panaciterrae]MBM7799497.1 very-short-patch-repair endonuclease [Microlunatus panaciterrae]